MGEVPQISVEIVNRSKNAVYLVGSLDASDCKWRYPHCYYEIIAPDGKSAVRSFSRCGNVNPLREKDFLRVPANGKFDPFQHVDDYGFFSVHVPSETFAAEGVYRICFVYSTGKKLEDWVQGKRAADERLLKLLKQVPKTTIKSNEITVRVVRPNEQAGRDKP